jgi:pimeloyl-ACP methyl ester carboxylesterase
LFVGFQWSTAQMFQELQTYDARRLGRRFEVPLFLLQGESDVVTVTSLATEYFGEVEAPTKGLALIKDAGHFAAFTQPERWPNCSPGYAPWQPRPTPPPPGRRDSD